jgi:hypothetical protein
MSTSLSKCCARKSLRELRKCDAFRAAKRCWHRWR